MDREWRFGFNFTYLWLGNNAIDAKASPLTGQVVGDYDASALVFGLHASLRLWRDSSGIPFRGRGTFPTIAATVERTRGHGAGAES